MQNQNVDAEDLLQQLQVLEQQLLEGVQHLHLQRHVLEEVRELQQWLDPPRFRFRVDLQLLTHIVFTLAAYTYLVGVMVRKPILTFDDKVTFCLCSLGVLLWIVFFLPWEAARVR